MKKLNKRALRKQKRAEKLKKIKLANFTKTKSAKASHYLYDFEDYFSSNPNLKVILYVRVSSSEQGLNKNLKNYIKVLQKEMKKRNISIIRIYKEVGSGWIIDENRTPFLNAVKFAKMHEAVIVAPSADRFLRSENFNTKTNPDVIPTEHDGTSTPYFAKSLLFRILESALIDVSLHLHG